MIKRRQFLRATSVGAILPLSIAPQFAQANLMKPARFMSVFKWLKTDGLIS
jgi:hypothetical protein